MAHPAAVLDVLCRFARTAAGGYDVTDALHELCDGAAELLDAAGAYATVFDGSRPPHVVGTDEGAVALEWAEEALRAGPCWEAIDRLTPVAIDDIRREHRWPELREEAQRYRIHSVLGLPLSFDGKRIGAIGAYDEVPRSWSSGDVESATVLADVATAYLITAQQLGKACEVAAQLQHALDSRVVIEQAKGKLAGERRITMEQAFALLRRLARNNNATIASVARAVVHRGLQPPESLVPPRHAAGRGHAKHTRSHSTGRAR